MLESTKNDMMRLQTYGAMYLGGIEPVDIENMYLDDRMGLDSLSQSIGRLAGEGQTNESMVQAANVVQIVFQAVQIVSQIVGVFTMGIGSVVGAVFGIVGAIISSVLRHEASVECDSEDCLDHDHSRSAPGTDVEWQHIRATVGIAVPEGVQTFESMKESRKREVAATPCMLSEVYGTPSQCEARWGMLSSYMNDGMWWWGKKDPEKHSDVLLGTVIGVRGRIDSGATAGCHRLMYGDPGIPVLPGMKGKPQSDSDLSQEFKARQEAVTKVLWWMARRMRFGVLSCIEKLLLNHRGGSQYVVCDSGPPYCYESSIAKYMGINGDRHDFGAGPTPYRYLIMSRMYASIRAMSQALVAECDNVGEKNAIEVLKLAGIPERVSRVRIKKAIKAQKENKEVWPEEVLISQMTFEQLKNALRYMSEFIVTQIADDPAARRAYAESKLAREQPFEFQRRKAQAAAEAATAAIRRREKSYTYASSVRSRVMELAAVNQRLLGGGGLGKYAPFWQRVPTWSIYTGAGLLTASSIYLIIEAIKEEQGR